MTVAVIVGGAVLVAVGLVLWKRSTASGSTSVRPTDVRRTDGPIHVQDSPEPLLEAGLWAANYFHGRHEITTIGATGSMLPFLKGGEVAVLVHDFEGIAIGSVVAYRTVGGSSPAVGSRLVHRIVGRNENGWLPRGDTPGCPVEDWNPITRDNYIGTLVAIFKKA